jgi:hypothetical protein
MMESMNFTHRLRKAAFALTAILLTQSLLIAANASLATGVATDLNISAQGPDPIGLNTEAREVERFADDLFTFSDQISSLSKKAKLTNAELASARTSGNALKQRIDSVRQNFRSVIDKLKAANQLETLDAKVNALITSGQSRLVFQRAGGARKLYEGLANERSPLSQEIDVDLQRLSSKVQSQSSFSEGELRSRAARVAYQPAPVFADGWRCNMAVGGYNLRIIFLGARFPAPDRINNRIDRLCGTEPSGDVVR